MKTPYWVIKCASGYWTEEGECAPRLRHAEKHRTRKEARREKKRWSFGKEAWLVRVVARERRNP